MDKTEQRKQVTEQLRRWRSLQGRQVSIALSDGRCIEGCQLISAGVSGTDKLWVFSNGKDVFVPVESVLDLWENGGPRRQRVA